MVLESSLLFCRKFRMSFSLTCWIPQALSVSSLHGIHGRARRVERLPDVATFYGPEELESALHSIAQTDVGMVSQLPRGFPATRKKCWKIADSGLGAAGKISLEEMP